MRYLLWCTALGLAATGGWSGLRASEPKPVPAKAEGSCGSHGTAVEFVDSPKEAAAQAKKEQKLVFVLHVSGLFEDPRFT